MKDLSVEQKAKRYDEALGKARQLCDYPTSKPFISDLQDLFPELKVSEGERMWKLLKKYVHYNISDTVLEADYMTRECLESWIEKQCEHAKFLNSIQVGDQVTRNEDGELFNLSQLNRVAKPNKQKSVDNVEPKFNVGDWIVYDNNVYKIINIPHDNYYECLGIDNTIRVYNSCIDDKSHLWTIKDAKAGDVLYYNDNIIVIFKYFHDDSSFCSYCYIDGGVFFTSNDRTPVWWMNNVFYPATKEQRELLFTKMKESGHEWDADKKELVEQMTGEEHKQYMLEHQDETIYDMSFEEAQDYLSKRGFDIPWNDGDVMVDERKLTQTVANVLKWADRHPLMLPYKKK